MWEPVVEIARERSLYYAVAREGVTPHKWLLTFRDRLDIYIGNHFRINGRSGLSSMMPETAPSGPLPSGTVIRPPLHHERNWIWHASFYALLFVLLGLPFLRKTGLHYDASSELACFYSCSSPVYTLTIHGHQLPLMVLQYLGTLKTWLYLPILRFLEDTPLVLRLPFAIWGGLSVWFFFAILYRIAGLRAAAIGALLLLTDVTFLVSTCYDFGPIALLHLLFLAGLFLLMRFDETHRARYLSLAFFLFGLALWHKALFIWMLTALVIASLVAIPRCVLKHATFGHLGLAFGSLCLGAAPLLYYNVVTGGATLHTSRVMSGAAPMTQKLLVLKKTFDGSVLFGWLTEDAALETAISPPGISGKVSSKLTNLIGEHRSNWMLYAFILACGLGPWLYFSRWRKLVLFLLVYLMVAWAQMIALPNTGASLHHIILLWPMPHFLIAIAFTEIWDRTRRGSLRLHQVGAYVVGIALVTTVAVNLVVVNSLYTDLVTRGTSTLWTDAVYPLSAYLGSLRTSAVVTVDWGYSSTLCLLSDGRMPIQDMSFSLIDPSPDDKAAIRTLMSDQGVLFVDHTDDGEQFPGVRQHLAAIAFEAGYTKRVINTIYDRNSRPRFEISRYFAQP